MLGKEAPTERRGSGRWRKAMPRRQVPVAYRVTHLQVNCHVETREGKGEVLQWASAAFCRLESCDVKGVGSGPSYTRVAGTLHRFHHLPAGRRRTRRKVETFSGFPHFHVSIVPSSFVRWAVVLSLARLLGARRKQLGTRHSEPRARHAIAKPLVTP